MDVLNVNYNQADIHLNRQDAYNFIRQEIQSTYKGTLSLYHLKHMYFEFDKKNNMASYLSLSYQAMKNVLQELDSVVKHESTSLPFVISPQKVESPVKKSMINQQISLVNQMLKNSKSDNAQHVLKIVELNDFDIEEMKVAKRQPLKHLKKTLLSPETSKEENKQASPIETYEKDNQTSPKKNRDRFFGSKNNKKNPTINNVVKKCNVPTKKGETPLTTYKRILCITLDVKTITKYTLDKILIHINGSNNICVDHPRK
jgi:hypothetical protein